MESQQKIVAVVYFNNGQQGLERVYDKNLSLKEYIKIFENEAIHSNLVDSVNVGFIKITQHNEDGSFKRDGKGRRIEKYLYDNRQLLFR